MNPRLITGHLQSRGYDHDTLLRRLRIRSKSLSMISRCINGKERTRAVESLVSEITGFPCQELWPQWYPSEGRGKKRL